MKKSHHQQHQNHHHNGDSNQQQDELMRGVRAILKGLVTRGCKGDRNRICCNKTIKHDVDKVKWAQVMNSALNVWVYFSTTYHISTDGHTGMCCATFLDFSTKLQKTWFFLSHSIITVYHHHPSWPYNLQNIPIVWFCNTVMSHLWQPANFQVILQHQECCTCRVLHQTV